MGAMRILPIQRNILKLVRKIKVSLKDLIKVKANAIRNKIRFKLRKKWRNKNLNLMKMELKIYNIRNSTQLIQAIILMTKMKRMMEIQNLLKSLKKSEKRRES
jgi:hypothetical protein